MIQLEIALIQLEIAFIAVRTCNDQILALGLNILNAADAQTIQRQRDGLPELCRLPINDLLGFFKGMRSAFPSVWGCERRSTRNPAGSR